MASGSSSGRPNNPASRSGFDFASDDILCSYDDFDNRHESFNGTRSDPPIGTNSTKDFHTTRVSRSSAFPTSNVYAQPEDSLNQELITAVERTVKRNGDNIMRFLEGLSSRLSQLELYCYNLDKSIGDMRSDLAQHNGDADIKLISMDKHLQEVHRSVQLIRDKQELAETQKELAKLQLAQKDEKSSRPSTGTKNTETAPEMQNQQLALALPHQICPAPPSRTSDNYLPSPQLPNPTAQSLPPQTSYIPAESQYRPPQMAAPNLPQPQVNQPQQQQQQFPQYQQQWVDPFPQAPAQPTQPPPMHSHGQVNQPQQQAQMNQPQQQAQMNQPPSQAQVNQPQQQAQQFPQYQQQWVDPFPQAPAQPTQPPQTTMHLQQQIQTPSQPAVYHPPYMQSHQQPNQGPPPGFPQQGVGRAGGPYPMYEGDGSRFSQGGVYPPPANAPRQNPPAGHMVRGPTPNNNPQQSVRNHPYNELVDKAVSMGYRGDHVASVVQRLEESGQPVDFNAVLDRLNAHSSGGSQRSW